MEVRSGPGGKSVYDPCPLGYRMPTKADWTNNADFTAANYTEDNRGFLHTGGVYYPKSYIRAYNSSALSGNLAAQFMSATAGRTSGRPIPTTWEFRNSGTMQPTLVDDTGHLADSGYIRCMAE